MEVLNGLDEYLAQECVKCYGILEENEILVDSSLIAVMCYTNDSIS